RLQRFERPVQIGHVGDVAIDQEVRAKLLCQRPDPLQKRIALIGESQLRALFAELLCNPPGERLVVGEAHDQPPLARHQPVHVASSSALASRTSFTVGSGGSASAALSCAPITTPRPMMKKKISAMITPARLP